MRKVIAIAIGAMLALSGCSERKEAANVAAESEGNVDEAATGVPGEGGGEGGEGGGDAAVPADNGANATQDSANTASTNEAHSEGGGQ